MSPYRTRRHRSRSGRAPALGLLGGSESSGAAGGPATSGADATRRPRSRPTPADVAGADGADDGRETPEATEPPEPEPYPVSLPAYFQREPDGGDLRLGAVREQHRRLHVVRRVVPQRAPAGDRGAQHPDRARALPRRGAGARLHRPGHLRLRPGDDPRARLPGDAGVRRLPRRLPQPRGLRRRPAGRPPAAHRLRPRRDQRRAGPAPLAAGARRRRPDRRSSAGRWAAASSTRRSRSHPGWCRPRRPGRR